MEERERIYQKKGRHGKMGKNRCTVRDGHMELKR